MGHNCSELLCPVWIFYKKGWLRSLACKSCNLKKAKRHHPLSKQQDGVFLLFRYYQHMPVADVNDLNYYVPATYVKQVAYYMILLYATGGKP